MPLSFREDTLPARMRFDREPDDPPEAEPGPSDAAPSRPRVEDVNRALRNVARRNAQKL